MASIVLCTAILICAAGAFIGVNKARWALVALVCAYYVLVGIDSLDSLIADDLDKKEEMKLTGRVARGVFFPVIFIWYFTTPKAGRFYAGRQEAREIS